MKISFNKTAQVFILLSLVLPCSVSSAEDKSVDVCVYGATPSGILAAVAVAREGHSVVIVEPGRWVGGILGAGIKPLQDCPNPAATGGLTKKLIYTLGKNPTSIRESFRKLLEEHHIPVIFEHRLNRVVKARTTITGAWFDLAPFDDLGCPPEKATTKNSFHVAAKIFIDSSYEGELMARAGISYRVARESSSAFKEEIGGVREPVQLYPIDPFVIPGDRQSGLLKWINGEYIEAVGSGDPHIQAYNYRFYVTSDPEQRAPITPPEDYDAKDFELVGRYVDHLKSSIGKPEKLLIELRKIFPGWLNGGEYNYQRKSLITIAPVGVSHLYADGSYEEKARVWKMHQDYLRGLHHFLITDSRVPEAFREETAELGLEKRHHPDTGGWPHQLYVRLTRRLEGTYTLTTEDIYNRTKVDDPICLAQYGIDVYPCRRVWLNRDGKTQIGLEGPMFLGGAKGPTRSPYPIPYGAITPKREQCDNVLVSICFSATHLGYASARMEPAFMICGEASGIAAVQAIGEGDAVQDIDRAVFRKSLEAANMMLEWTQPPLSAKSDKLSFEKLINKADRDNDQVIQENEWQASKPGWEWLFSVIDKNNDRKIDAAEYQAFQKYKKDYPNWSQELKP